MAQIYSPKIVTDSLVMCLDASNNKSYSTTDLPVKGGLVMWMDAADDTTFSYSSGTTVSQWRDKSGYNYHMVPVSAGPTRNAFLNSRKVIACTTSQQIWNSAINLVSSPYTIFCVTRLSGITPNRVLSTLYTGANGTNWLLGHWGGHYNQYYAEGWVQYQGYPADNTWRMYMGDWSGSSTDLANLYSNGTAITTNSNGANAGPLGLGINISSEVSTCEAAEIIVFNRVLSTAERRLVHTYLGQKWGISNTDRSIIDLAGNDDNGLLGNGTVANMPVYDYYNKGSLSFDGSNDYITIPSSASIKNTSSLTLEAWVYISNSMNYYGGIFGKGTTDTDEEYCLLVHSVNSKVYMDVGSTGGPYTDATFSFSLNTWYHIIGTHERIAGSSTIKIYVNGSLLSSSTVGATSAVNDNSTAATIGSRYSTGGSPWNGKIANAKIYTRALSAAEVAQNYEAQKSKFANTIVQQGLVLNLDASNPYSYARAGSTWYDVSGTGNNTILTNGPVYSSDIGGNIIFDGVDDYADVVISSLSSTVTLDFWVKYTNLTSNMIFGFLLYDIYGYSGALGFNTASGDVYGLTSTQITNLGIIGNWTNIVFVMRSDVSYTNNKIYVNGIVQTLSQVLGSENTGVRSFNSGNGRISGWRNDTGYKLPASISSLRAYNRELSAAEVLQNYNATKGRFGL